MLSSKEKRIDEKITEVASSVFECFIFIQDILWSFVTPNKDVALLPDDILIDILSRLPAHSILQCHRVCRDWRALTSTRQFAEMQFRRAESTIFMQCYHPLDHGGTVHFLVFDENAKRFQKLKFKSKVVAAMKKYGVIKLCCSFGGLLLFEKLFPPIACVVIDPFTEVVKWIYFPFGFGCGTVCGLFFQPLASEYKVLLYTNKDYYVYGSKSLTWRNITFGSFPFRPHVCSPVLLNQALHWILDPASVDDKEIDLCIHAVMVFDMGSEKFHTMPHPNVQQYRVKCRHIMMYLFEKDESLYLCDMYDIFDGLIEMWQLKDYRNWIWVKRYRLNVQMFPMLRELNQMSYFLHWSHKNICILSMNKDELLIDWFSYGLFILNLKKMTLRELERCDVRDSDGSLSHPRPKLFISHKNCMHPTVRL
ncbi:hypothetical protein LIER_38750 [Lithospermum erythrorhizon]|uniref:F-box domain-containing protein n=1 Tax=Lithospermum erythrorhizon TaxID=34254 RepID=A0AAV3Q4P1_LITER